MPIVNRIDMLTTGIRSEVGVKIHGADLATLESLARRVAEVVRTVHGASNVYPEQVTSGQYLNLKVNREAAARYGLSVGDVQQVIEHAIGETTVSTTVEGRQRFPIRVRYAPEHRRDPGGLERVLVATPAGAQVPLSAVVSLSNSRGPAMISSENGLLLATVLLNVQGRDVGGFVREAREVVARQVSLPGGYYIDWSGRWENQEHARHRLQIVLPIVLVVIFILLYFTYRSASEAAHVLLAVPFALSGGVYLLWLLGYNFSVAVWVGFIALFGTAVQTAVVMVIYLDEAVQRKRDALGGGMTHGALRDAVVEGALLRLRPKVMTVSTVVAGLLPIMWSTRVGAEVMKPLAAPVLGGMISSLAHVLIVTPVIFFWLRERQLGLRSESAADREATLTSWRRPLAAIVLAGVAVGGGWRWYHWQRTSTPSETSAHGRAVFRTKSGDLDVALLSPTGRLHTGANTFTIEFTTNGKAVDVGTVHATGNMPMPGMVMPGAMKVQPTGVPGRYGGTANFGMAGAWQMSIEWDGPAGKGSVAFEGAVQ
jgi:Cu(I)/Ag(I) efflux system membrane protein CusA/SilA